MISVVELKKMRMEEACELSMSDDYKMRFLGEYSQLLIRYEALQNMVDKWDSGCLEFTPTCPRSTYRLQLRVMRDYLDILEARAVMEGIDLTATSIG